MAGNMIVLRGRIADERSGAPVVGADVKAAHVPSEKASPPYPADGTAVTGQDGRYELRLGYAGPKEPELLLEIHAPGYEMLRWWSRQLSVEKLPAELKLDFKLNPGFSVELTVQDSEGRPLVGAETRVICTSTDGRYCYWPLHRYIGSKEQDKTDDAGRIVWQGFSERKAATERYVIAIRHPEFAEHLIQRPEDLLREHSLARTRVRLQRGVSLLVRVRAEQTHEPIRAVALSARYQDETGLVPCCHGIEKGAETDASGRCTIVGLNPGRYCVVAEHSDWMKAARHDVEVKVGVPELELALARGRVARNSFVMRGMWYTAPLRKWTTEVEKVEWGTGMHPRGGWERAKP